MPEEPREYGDDARQDDARQLAKWAERYARSRTIPFLVQWVFIVLLVIMLAGLAQGAIYAWRARQPGLLWLIVAVTFALTLALLWFSIARWGRERIWAISEWFYRKEGYAAFGGGNKSDELRRMRWLTALGFGLMLYHLAGAVLVGLRYLPMPYFQPFSAVYMAPFLAAMIVVQRLGWWAWIWPALYVLHALLMVSGVWWPFPGQWFFLDIIVPVFGYGLISMVVGHIYSRYALRRLKRLARAGLEEGGEGGNGPGEQAGRE